MTCSGGSSRAIIDVTRPFGYMEWMSNVQELLHRYPFLGYERIGNSVLGFEIGAVRIGTGPKELFLNGAIHANEWITALLLAKFIEECAEALDDCRPLRGKNIKQMFADTTLWVSPMVNPDGVELVLRGTEEHPYRKQLIDWNGGSTCFAGWKANIRGVDLNDQFPANWETERERRCMPGPGPRDYCGEAPLSEPEAEALFRFTCERCFRCVVALHTQGKEIYWNYRDLEPPESESIAERLARASGYLPVKLEGSDAGYKDWFIQAFRRPGFTVEAGLGTNPLPLEGFAGIYEDLAGLMLEALEV